MSLIFVGGWATAKEQYPVISESGKFLIPFVDFKPEELPELISGGGNTLVGWSTGAHILLKECRAHFTKFDNVILIGPFLSFTESFPERILRKMISGMSKNPTRVLASFHKNCGENNKINFFDSQVGALVEGLEYLISSRIEIENDIAISNLILVHGNDDKIVRQTAFESVTKSFSGGRIVTFNSGHKLSEDELLNLIKGL
ncbi:hypothetical protein [Maridesulfovibrio frigidus]|uniref:hypothetical protein n=1 Tax=Maridesulfovibrio frigidus TaxID=340956 RepID=UPI0004E0DCD9|nr:hypothetical protein [Maridesulfovibrio frigidus]